MFDNAGELFLRQLRTAEFDVSEMSLASLAVTIERGGSEWLAIPVPAAADVPHQAPGE